MSKKEIKDLLIFIIFSIINISLAYMITSYFGIQNIILYQSLTAMQYTITYEVIIFFVLSIVEATIYHYKYEIYE